MKGVILALGLVALGAVSPAWADPAPAAAAAQPVDLEQIKRIMTGTWQNIADTRFVRELRADGTSTDSYEGDETATSSGTWVLFSGASQPPDMVWRKLPADGVYLKLSEHGDVYLFALTALNPQTMQMINIDRKLPMTFSRLK